MPPATERSKWAKNRECQEPSPSQNREGPETAIELTQVRIAYVMRWPRGAPCLDYFALNRPELSNNIIQKGLAFGRDWSGTVDNSGRRGRFEILPRRLVGRGGASVVAARCRHEPNGGSRWQSLQSQRRRRSQLHHPQRLFPPQSRRNRQLAKGRLRRAALARSNPASSRCCSHRQGRRSPR
jgi:hypothetical protein